MYNVELYPTHSFIIISSNIHYVQKSFTSHTVVSTLLEYPHHLPTCIS